MLVDVHGDLNVFMSQAMLHILGGGAQLRKHGGMGVTQGMVVELLKLQFPCCNSTDMLHGPAVDIGTIRSDHNEMHFFSLSGCVEMPKFISVLTDVKVAVEIACFFLTGLLPFQCRHDIRRKLNGSDTVVLGQGEVPVGRKRYLKKVKILAEAQGNVKRIIKLACGKLACLFLSNEKINREYEYLTHKYQISPSGRICTADVFARVTELPAIVLEDSIILETHEGEFRVPKRYTEFLECRYGEYKKYMPIADRVNEVLNSYNYLENYRNMRGRH